MAFIEFLKRLYDIESSYVGPEGAAAGPDADAGGDLGSLLSLFQGGAEAGRPARMGGPMLGGGGGPINLAPQPNAGDLADTNREVGGSPLQGLFGQSPTRLMAPPPGINQRRPGRP